MQASDYPTIGEPTHESRRKWSSAIASPVSGIQHPLRRQDNGNYCLLLRSAVAGVGICRPTERQEALLSRCTDPNRLPEFCLYLCVS
jgi:hypothetical protein